MEENNGKRLERVSFVIPFSDKGELLSPHTKFDVDAFPTTIDLLVRVGFVGLKPKHRYAMTIYITPSHMQINQGDSIQVGDSFSEIASVDIKTKEPHDNMYLDGQVTINIERLKLPAKGIYQIKCNLSDYESNEPVTTGNAYFSAERKL